MILPFSTKLNEKPTYFVDKIWSGLIDRKLATIETCRRYEYNREKVTPNEFAIVPHYKPKLHTIREDKNNRWQVGTNINFYINARQKNMFRFAPVLQVVRVQNIEIIYVPFGDKKQDARPFVRVDGRLIYDVGQTLWSQMKEFAENDGFDCVNDFFEYFDKDFTGKIIHWTDLKY